MEFFQEVKFSGSSVQVSVEVFATLCLCSSSHYNSQKTEVIIHCTDLYSMKFYISQALSHAIKKESKKEKKSYSYIKKVYDNQAPLPLWRIQSYQKIKESNQKEVEGVFNLNLVCCPQDNVLPQLREENIRVLMIPEIKK